MDCPTASDSGRTGSKRPTRQDVQGGSDLRTIGLRQVVAREGGTSAPAGETCPYGLHRGDPGGDGDPAAEGRCGRFAPNCQPGWAWSIRWRRSGRDGCSASGQKVLLVLDQFEQWLHAKRGEENTELVAALRQCDGEHVQAVVMVRDDFWLAVSRFMDELEIEFLQGQNIALVDLFDPRHARKVLTAFGHSLRDVTREDGRHLQGPANLPGSSDSRDRA